MGNNNLFFIDILQIMPEDIDCYIQAPTLEDETILDMMEPTEYHYFQNIHIDNKTRIPFLKKVREEHIADHFQEIQIRKGNVPLFQGYDGVEVGVIISKNIDIPLWFKEKYTEDWDYAISKDW